MKESERGFTLIELLLAVVLLATLTAMLAGGVSMVSRHVNRGNAEIDRAGMVALVQKYLRNTIDGAIPVSLATGNDTGDVATIDFDGSATDLAFIGHAPASVPFGGLMKLGLRFAAGGREGPGALVLDWQPYNGDDADEPDTDSAHRGTRPLLSGISRAAFAYYDSGSPDRAGGWLGDWHDQASLPSLVKISAVFSDGGVMPDLIVALRLANPVVTGPAPGTQTKQ